MTDLDLDLDLDLLYLIVYNSNTKYSDITDYWMPQRVMIDPDISKFKSAALGATARCAGFF